MSYFNSQGEAIPEHLWRLGLAVRALIEQYDAMEKWRRHVRGWVKHVREAADDPERAGIVVTYLPQTLKIDEEYALLAWLGNKAAVAAEHYLQVTDADFSKAASEGPASAALALHAGNNSGQLETTDAATDCENTALNGEESSPVVYLSPCGMGDEGLEPPTLSV